MRSALPCLLTVFCLGCGERAAQPSTPAPSNPAPTPPAPQAAAPSPSPNAAPATFVVINEGRETRVVDQTDGDLMSIAIVRLSPAADPRDEPDDANGCRCYCDALLDCVDCEAPMPRPLPIAAGERAVIEWSGVMRRPSRVDRQFCNERYAPAPGEYAIIVCSEDHVCGRSDVTLPATSPIEVRLPAEPPSRASCEDIGQEERDRAQAYIRGVAEARLAYQALGNHGGEPAPIPECEVRCVADESELSADAGCIHYLIPRGDRVESVLTLPSGPMRISLDVFQTRIIW